MFPIISIIPSCQNVLETENNTNQQVLLLSQDFDKNIATPGFQWKTLEIQFAYHQIKHFPHNFDWFMQQYNHKY